MTLIASGAGYAARKAASRLHMVVLAGAVALAGLASSAAPARSSDADDLIRFLLGAAAIAVIIGAIDDRHRPRYLGRWVLPDSCLETARVRGRNVAVYNARCLSRAGYSNLPRRCYVDLRTHRGNRGSYVATCLYDAGYRAEGPTSRPPRYDPPRHDTRPPGIRPPGHDIRPPAQRSLPGHCEMHYRERGQRVWGFDGRCLYNAGLRNLPGACRVRDRAGNSYYNGNCLLQRGYSRSRR